MTTSTMYPRIATVAPERRPRPEAEESDRQQREHDPHHVLQHAPAEQRLLGRSTRSAPPAARDVDDHHTRRQGDRQADQDGATPTDPECEGRADDDERGQQHLRRGCPQDRTPVADQPHRIDLDPDLEQSSTTPTSAST